MSRKKGTEETGVFTTEASKSDFLFISKEKRSRCLGINTVVKKVGPALHTGSEIVNHFDSYFVVSNRK